MGNGGTLGLWVLGLGELALDTSDFLFSNLLTTLPTRPSIFLRGRGVEAARGGLLTFSRCSAAEAARGLASDLRWDLLLEVALSLDIL